MTHATETVIRKTITVNAPVERAFEVFTAGIGAWWPIETHSVGRGKAETVVLEGRRGGRLFERQTDGAESDWGQVIVWDPPHRVAFTWHPGRGVTTAQEVEVHFTAVAGSTRVDLEHRGWENLGDLAAETIPEYDSGWDHVLGHLYAEAASR